jgi:hypothetical protein
MEAALDRGVDHLVAEEVRFHTEYYMWMGVADTAVVRRKVVGPAAEDYTEHNFPPEAPGYVHNAATGLGAAVVVHCHNDPADAVPEADYDIGVLLDQEAEGRRVHRAGRAGAGMTGCRVDSWECHMKARHVALEVAYCTQASRHWASDMMLGELVRCKCPIG